VKRALLALFAAAAIVVPVLPAHAQAPGVNVSIGGVGDGQIVEGTVGVHGAASASTGVDNIELAIDGVVVASSRPSGIRQDIDIPYGWNTAISTGSSQIAANGQYSVRVSASANGGGSDSATISVRVDNPAAAPTGVATSSSDDTVTVSWNANPEPDISGYRVERDGGSGYASVGEVNGTVFSEKVSPGDYNYRVMALRPSPSQGTRASAPSGSAAVNIAAPAPSSNGNGNGKTSGSKGNSGGNGGMDFGFGGGAKGSKSAKTHLGFESDPYSARGRSIAVHGLPTGAALPGLPGGFGLPRLPDTTEMNWGSYEEELPYDLPSGGVALTAEAQNIAARSPWRVIPPDGLRWVAAGLLFLVTGAILRFGAVRLAELAGPETPQPQS
jgi:hypothetical protein